jgi:hypothetical protein
MAINTGEFAQIYQQTGCGILPLTGGPATSLKSTIGMSMPFQIAVGNVGPASGVMGLSGITLSLGQTISNINYAITTAATTPTHYWYALYDDGRGSTTANQLALLGQTADQLTAAVSANTMIGLSLTVPWVTQYSGIYFLAVMCTAAASPGWAGTSKTQASFVVSSLGTSSFLSSTAGSGLTTNAPNPSGALSVRPGMEFAYVS